MTSFLFLETSDFSIRSGEKGQVLFLTFQPRGMTLVLFYSNQCPHCQSFMKDFKQLPSVMNGCQFAMTNIEKYPAIAQMSRSTIVPIQYVPDIILFVNGFPYVRYEGAPDISSITTFLLEMNKKIKSIGFMEPSPSARPPAHPPVIPPSSTTFPSTPSASSAVGGRAAAAAGHSSDIPSPANLIPEYTIGVPLYGEHKRDKVCYLNFTNAYVQAN